MPILPFSRKRPKPRLVGVGDLLQGFSIEVMPRTAAKIADFRAILPAGTRVYIAHIEGTEIDDMVDTAKRLTDEGFRAMPHIPARIIKDRAEFETWLIRYAAEAGAIYRSLPNLTHPEVPVGGEDRQATAEARLSRRRFRNTRRLAQLHPRCHQTRC